MSTSRRMSGYALGRAGARLGLVMGVIYAGLLISFQASADDEGVALGIAFGVSYVAPFLAAILATGIGDLDRRIAVWVASGVIGALLSFSGAIGTIPLLVPAGMLLVAAWRSHREARCRPRLGTVSASLGLVGVGIGSVILAFALRGVTGAMMSVAPWVVALALVLAISRRRDDPVAS